MKSNFTESQRPRYFRINGVLFTLRWLQMLGMLMEKVIIISDLWCILINAVFSVLSSLSVFYFFFFKWIDAPHSEMNSVLTHDVKIK